MKIRGRLYQMYRSTVLRNFDRWTTETDAFQPEQAADHLKALLAYANAHVPYFADRAGRFEALPVLTKSLIRQNFERLKSDDLSQRKWFLNSSGGSTGQPVSLVQDQDFLEWSAVTEDFFYRRLLGMEFPVMPMVELWGSERDFFGDTEGVKTKLRNWLLQMTFLNSFRMTRDDIARYIEIINRKKPRLLKGYAGSLYEIAKYAKEHGVAVHSPEAMYSAAETLRPFMRELIEQVFRCKVCDFYGSREVGPIAGECRSGRLHLFSFNNLVEVVDANNRPVGAGQEGRVLVTTLHNYSMPLIRYEIGDTAVVGPACNCGVSLPTLERVTGRMTDHFVARDGALVHGEYFTHLFYYRDWVSEFQVLQKEVDRIEISYVRAGSALKSDMDDISKKIRLVMGNDCRIEWCEVSEIPRTPQGKLLFTRSLVRGERHEP